MADNLITVADHLADAADLSDAEVSDLIQSANFLMNLPVELSSNGTSHKYSKEIGAPVVGFRTANDGRDFDHSTDEIVTIDLKILDFSSAVDMAVAQAWRSGGASAFVSRESFRHLKQAWFKFEQQIFQGTGGDAAGFAGLPDADGLNGLADEMVVDATGTAGNDPTSVYLVKRNPDNVSAVLNSDSILEIQETVTQNFIGANGNYPALYTPGMAWVGLQIGGKFSVVRICNLTTEAGKGLTDDLIFQAMSQSPGEFDVIVGSRRSREQLRLSRTATNSTGSPAPTPTEVGGVPLIVSEGISNSETIVA